MAEPVFTPAMEAVYEGMKSFDTERLIMAFVAAQTAAARGLTAAEHTAITRRLRREGVDLVSLNATFSAAIDELDALAIRIREGVSN